MKLTLEKDVKIAVEVNGEIFVGEETGVLYQFIDKDVVFLYVKSSNDEKKEIKIKITKKEENVDCQSE